MRRTFHILLLLAIFLALLPGVFTPVKGQIADEQQKMDSLRVEELYANARENYEEGQPNNALNMLGQALQMALSLNMEQSETRVLTLIGDIYVSENDPEEAIPYYLRVASLLEFKVDRVGLLDIYQKIGAGYSTAGVHEKARDYYLKAEHLLKDKDIQERLELTKKLNGSDAQDVAKDFLKSHKLI